MYLLGNRRAVRLLLRLDSSYDVSTRPRQPGVSEMSELLQQTSECLKHRTVKKKKHTKKLNRLKSAYKFEKVVFEFCPMLILVLAQFKNGFLTR